jgi:uncharacterized protein (TIGR03437 family)
MGDGTRADFTGWPGGTGVDWNVKLTGDPMTVTAPYRTMNRLAAISDPPDGAAFSTQPASADGFYDAQSVVTVTAAPRPGFKFRIWGGDLAQAGATPTAPLDMSRPRNVVAVLDRIPYIGPAGVQNAAGVTPLAAVAPGSIVSIFGVNLAAGTAVGPDSPLVQTLGGVTVRLGDQLLPLYFASPSQINLELPPDLAEGKQTLAVSSTGQPDIKGDFVVARNAPGLFQQIVDDKPLAVGVHEDGSAITADSPVRKGELVTIYGTGFGPADHPRPEGLAVPASPVYNLVDRVTVLLGDATPNAESAIAVPGRVGLDAVRFRVDNSTPGGVAAPLRVRINGQESNTVGLPVQ